MAAWLVPDDLPPGSYVTPLRDNHAGPPVLWVTTQLVPQAGAHWGRLRTQCAANGLWPLVLAPLDGEPWAPWHDGEFDPVPLPDVAARDPGQVLAELWHATAEITYVDDELVSTPGAWRDAALELGLPDVWPG